VWLRKQCRIWLAVDPLLSYCMLPGIICAAAAGIKPARLCTAVAAALINRQQPSPLDQRIRSHMSAAGGCAFGTKHCVISSITSKGTRWQRDVSTQTMAAAPPKSLSLCLTVTYLCPLLNRGTHTPCACYDIHTLLLLLLPLLAVGLFGASLLWPPLILLC
jgi:hypothetical protein